MSNNGIEHRIKRGSKAIELAKLRGMDTALWEQQLAALQSTLAAACALAAGTGEQLRTRGWCVWQCAALDDDLMLIVRDDTVSGTPAGIPRYTVAELEMLHRHGMSSFTMRMVHAVKKRAPARVMACIKNGVIANESNSHKSKIKENHESITGSIGKGEL